MKLHEVPDGFVEEVKRMTVPELVMMRAELKRYPEDKLFLDAIVAEFKRRTDSGESR